MWAKRLRLSNFRGFADLDLDLDRRLTVLVGGNGSGKSTVLQALAMAGDLVSVLRRPKGQLSKLVPVHRRDVRVGSTRARAITDFVSGGEPFSVEALVDAEDHEWRVELRQGSVESLAQRSPGPAMFLATTDRRVEDADVRDPDAQPNARDRFLEDHGVVVPSGYARFVEWFREREDVENERRVAARDFNLEDPQLRSVRQAVAALMPGFENLRIQRDPSPAMVVTKNDQLLRLDQLSDGERNLVALAGDLARRMALANPGMDSPRETEAVVLIDEVEQHLHPAWQRRVVPALQKAFPGAQLIVTTHSPQVLSTVPRESVILLQDFEAFTVSHPTAGRDSNAILREVFGVPERPGDDAQTIREIQELIDENKLAEARARLDGLAARLSPDDDEVVGLSMRLHVAEAGE